MLVLGSQISVALCHFIYTLSLLLEIVTDFIFLGSKITLDMTAAMKLEDAYCLEEKL